MLKQALSDSWNFFKNHLNALFLIVLPIAVPVQILLMIMFPDAPAPVEGAEASAQSNILMRMFFGILLAPVYRIAVIVYLASVIDGNIMSRMECWKVGIKYWIPYLALSMILSFVISTGFLIFIIPGVFLAVRLAFAEFELLFNNESPLASLKKSFDMTQPYFGVILRGNLIIITGLLVPYILLSGVMPYAVVSVLSIILSITLYIAMTVFSYRVYEMIKAENTPTES